MKKLVIILACMLICLSLFSGCTDNKDNSNSSTGLGNSVDVDGDIVFDFKDPENADGIIVTLPKNNRTE